LPFSQNEAVLWWFIHDSVKRRLQLYK